MHAIFFASLFSLSLSRFHTHSRSYPSPPLTLCPPTIAGNLCRTSWMLFTSPTAVSGSFYGDGAPKTGLGFTLATSGTFAQHYCKYTLTVTDPEGVSWDWGKGGGGGG